MPADDEATIGNCSGSPINDILNLFVRRTTPRRSVHYWQYDIVTWGHSWGSMPSTTTIPLIWLVSLWSGPADVDDPKVAQGPLGVVSPDGQVRVELLLEETQQSPGALSYRVTFHGRPVVLNSALHMKLADGSRLGTNSVLEKVELSRHKSEYQQHPGKRRLVVDHYSELIVTLREREKPMHKWEVVVRAYHDGIAFRYRFPAQEDWSNLELAEEGSVFTFPPDAVAVALPLNRFSTSYENRYERKAVSNLPDSWLIGLPLLVELPATGWAAITEANLTDYGGMYLARHDPNGASLVSRLSPRLDEPTIAVRARLPHQSPWRVVFVAEQPERLFESDLLLNLNAPSTIPDVLWIKPGKTTFPWWNSYWEDDVPFQPGLNTATVRHYIDFCAESGIEYHSLDGKGNTAWYGGPIVPYQGADPTTAVEGLDLAAVLEYAKQRGVRLRLWMHWQAAQAHMARAFPLYRQWGIEGVMIDFMDRDDQEMVNFQRELIRLAAANQLTVTFHGVAKPTGLERTYPNLLTSEAVLNLEYDKWDEQGVSPEHEVTVPFTRMLAGPLDFHQGSFRTVRLPEFKPRNEAPLVIGTPCRTLASYVVFQNHLPMIADYPSAYRKHAALPVLVQIPATWDNTRALGGKVGEYVSVARRRGDQWWVGAMTNREARELTIPLGFLGEGRFRAEIYRDDMSAVHHFSSEMRDVTAADVIAARLEPAGGLLIRLSPALPER